jgi:diaminopimelate decarboxylase
MGLDIKTLVEKYDTPLYIYDFNNITKQYQKLKEAFWGKKSLIAYAVKSNSNLAVIRHLAKSGAGADCVSIGEVKRALKAGIKRYKIIFSGVGKRDNEIKEALEENILLLNLESEAEMKRVEMIAKKLKIEARISIRVNPNVNPQTHPYISTGLRKNKFGVDIDIAKKMYLYAKESKYLNPIGIHFHIGSQLTELSPIEEACKMVADLVRSLKAIEIDIKFFDIGGGLGVIYNQEVTINLKDYALAVIKSIKGLDMTIITEPGRYIMANSGIFITRVLYEKQNGEKRFVIVDGAMNDLLRPSLYNAYHKIEALQKSGDRTRADVVGPICESGDFLGKDIELPPLEHNDILIVHSSGAYGFTMSSNYNTRGKVAEIAILNNREYLIRQRERFEDQIRLEEACDSSWQ